MKDLFIAIALLIALAGQAAAQGNDFPPPDGSWTGVPPFTCCGTSVPGGNGVKYGPVEQRSVHAGDIVYFDFVMDRWGGRPTTTWLITDGFNNVRWTDQPWNEGTYHWDRGNDGGWCWRCRWVGVANRDFPIFGIGFRRSGNFDAHIEIVGIIEAHPNPTPLMTQASKQSAAQVAAVSFTLASAAFGSAAATCAVGAYGWCAILTIAGLGSWYATEQADHVANDPFDPEYASYYAADWNYDELSSKAPWVQLVADDGTDGWFMSNASTIADVSSWTNAQLKALAVTLDRLQSCIDVGDQCQVWQRDVAVEYFHSAGAWMSYQGDWYIALADYLYAIGLNDENDSTGWIWWYGYNLQVTGAEFQAVTAN